MNLCLTRKNDRMNMKKRFKFPWAPSLFLFLFFSLFPQALFSGNNNRESALTNKVHRRFRDFRTDLSKSSIDLERIVDGEGGKNGIPVLIDPHFITLKKAALDGSVRGVLVKMNRQKRFYPFSILVWHYIVNDTMEGVSYAVTFCPLCQSAVVFSRKVLGGIVEFRVSGKLFESNLLMYDTHTESFWAQALGKAVAGFYTGTGLEIIPMQLLTVSELAALYPDALVLDRMTGHDFNYDRNPFSGYEQSGRFHYPVSFTDPRLPPKTAMYVFRLKERSVAFTVSGLGNAPVRKRVMGENVSILRKNGEITVFSQNRVVPGYYQMWFIWALHHRGDGILLDLEK